LTAYKFVVNQIRFAVLCCVLDIFEVLDQGSCGPGTRVHIVGHRKPSDCPECTTVCFCWWIHFRIFEVKSIGSISL